jgi:hypothetical protein
LVWRCVIYASSQRSTCFSLSCLSNYLCFFPIQVNLMQTSIFLVECLFIIGIWFSWGFVKLLFFACYRIYLIYSNDSSKWLRHDINSIIIALHNHRPPHHLARPWHDHSRCKEKFTFQIYFRMYKYCTKVRIMFISIFVFILYCSIWLYMPFRFLS